MAITRIVDEIAIDSAIGRETAIEIDRESGEIGIGIGRKTSERMETKIEEEMIQMLTEIPGESRLPADNWPLERTTLPRACAS